MKALDDKAIDKLEDEFRMWAFHTYYDAYVNEPNLQIRLIRAIVEAAKPATVSRMVAWKAARKEIAQITTKFNKKKIDRAEWARLVQAAILSHTGKVIPNRAWQCEHPEDVRYG